MSSSARRSNPDQPDQRRARQQLARQATYDRLTSSAPIGYPESLPIIDRRDELVQAIRDHQVVVVCGETGSGKTTQLPKMCLELARGNGRK